MMILPAMRWHGGFFFIRGDLLRTLSASTPLGSGFNTDLPMMELIIFA